MGCEWFTQTDKGLGCWGSFIARDITKRGEKSPSRPGSWRGVLCMKVVVQPGATSQRHEHPSPSATLGIRAQRHETWL